MSGEAAQNERSYQAGMPVSRMSGSPNLLHLPGGQPPVNRLPHSPALPVAAAIPDTAIPFWGQRSSLTNVKETKMTYELEIQIEELRAELRDAVDGAERRQIQAELEIAQAELAIAAAEMDGLVEAEPPF